jgi:hypothetical protein
VVSDRFSAYNPSAPNAQDQKRQGFSAMQDTSAPSSVS